MMTINWGLKVLPSDRTMTNDWNLLEFHTLLFSQNSSEQIKKVDWNFQFRFQPEMLTLFDLFPR